MQIVRGQQTLIRAKTTVDSSCIAILTTTSCLTQARVLATAYKTVCLTATSQPTFCSQAHAKMLHVSHACLFTMEAHIQYSGLATLGCTLIGLAVLFTHLLRCDGRCSTSHTGSATQQDKPSSA